MAGKKTNSEQSAILENAQSNLDAKNTLRMEE